MSKEEQPKPTRQIVLNSDQFEISDDGEVVIKSDEIAGVLQSQLAQVTPTEAGGTHVSVTLKSSSK